MAIETSLSVQILRDGETLIASVSGALDGSSAPTVGDRIAAAAVPGSATVLLLDLGATQWIDSDGIRWLNRMREDLKRAGIAVRVGVRAGSRVERTLRLLQLGEQFTIDRYPQERAA